MASGENRKKKTLTQSTQRTQRAQRAQRRRGSRVEGSKVQWKGKEKDNAEMQRARRFAETS